MNGPGSQVPADGVFTVTKILGSSMSKDPATGESEGLLFNVSGLGFVDFDGLIPMAVGDDNQGEGDDEAEAFGQIGMICRPLPPSGKHHAEAICARMGDGLTPIAHRDTRLKMAGDGPGVGTQAWVSYGGGFVSQSPVMSGDNPISTIQVIYCPFAFNDAGVPQKAHSIILDPSTGNESISVIHADGAAITMMKSVTKGTQLVLKNDDGSCSLTLDNSGITITGNVTIGGSLILGDPLTSLPLAPSSASPNFRVSPAP